MFAAPPLGQCGKAPPYRKASLRRRGYAASDEVLGSKLMIDGGAATEKKGESS